MNKNTIALVAGAVAGVYAAKRALDHLAYIRQDAKINAKLAADLADLNMCHEMVSAEIQAGRHRNLLSYELEKVFYQRLAEIKDLNN